MYIEYMKIADAYSTGKIVKFVLLYVFLYTEKEATLRLQIIYGIQTEKMSHIKKKVYRSGLTEFVYFERI